MHGAARRPSSSMAPPMDIYFIPVATCPPTFVTPRQVQSANPDSTVRALLKDMHLRFCRLLPAAQVSILGHMPQKWYQLVWAHFLDPSGLDIMKKVKKGHLVLVPLVTFNPQIHGLYHYNLKTCQPNTIQSTLWDNIVDLCWQMHELHSFFRAACLPACLPVTCRKWPDAHFLPPHSCFLLCALFCGTFSPFRSIYTFYSNYTGCLAMSVKSETPLFSDICWWIRLPFYVLNGNIGGFDLLKKNLKYAFWFMVRFRYTQYFYKRHLEMAHMAVP